MSSTQHRCVFVGNIPYDATEEQLIRICEEVGPVVSFRLVIDKETGKPKGYGFCEYRDEETALSARRNLQGYEINGRQLRVDFAENEKGSADRNREQVKGRGGPGFVDISKQTGGSNTLRDPFLYQPVGLPAAVSAAAVMTGLLGAPQMSVGSNAAGGAGRSPLGIDALTVHLAGMSMHQLCEVLHLVKNFIQQNQQQARQVLTANPQLVKALFQAQIIVGRVPQVPAQMSHTQSMSQPHVIPPQLGQAQIPSGSQLQPQSQGVQQSQVQRSQNFPFQLPSHPHQQLNAKTPAMLLPPQTLPPPPPPSSSSLPSQSLAMQRSQSQPPLPMNPPPLPHQPRPLLPSSLQQAQSAQGAGFQHPLSQQSHLPQIQQPSGMPPTNAGLPYQGAPPPLPYQPPPHHHVQMPRTGGDLGGNAGIGQGGLPSSAGMLDASTSASLGGTSQLGRGPGTEKLSSSTPFLKRDQLPSSSRSMMGVPLETSSMVAMSMAMGPGYSSVGASASQQQGVIRSAPSEGTGRMYAQEHSQPVMQPLRQQEPQVSLELEQQKALLQQVMNLTPEQVNSLPPEQRQQVLDLQQAFRFQLI